MNKTLLWLDDIRNPNVWAHEWAPEYAYNDNFPVIWVKSYAEFVNWITDNGLPDMIAFDHDLEPDHYIGNIIDFRKVHEGHIEYGKTGMDAAHWLVDYCLDRNCKLPEWVIQSANPAGKDNIQGLLSGYVKHYNK